MGNLMIYSGITTKIKAMESRLLTSEDFKRIAQLETTQDFLSYLKQQAGYKDIFQSIGDQALHRGQIEPILANALYLEYGKIYRFATNEQRKVLFFVFFRYEVSILKTCLQHVFNEKTNFDLSSFALFFKQHSRLKISELLSSKSLDEFISHLQGSDYYTLFTQLRNAGFSSLYDYESQLDIFYFKKIWKLKNKTLKGSSLKSTTHIIGTQIDLLNIMWIYRSKKYYDVDTGNIYATIIPCHYKLRKEQVTRLVEANNIEEFISIVSTTYYQHIGKDLTPSSLEDAYKQLMNHIYKKTKQENPYSMVPVLCFLHEKEEEIDKLTTALECIRYRLEPEEISHYIQAV